MSVLDSNPAIARTVNANVQNFLDGCDISFPPNWEWDNEVYQKRINVILVISSKLAENSYLIPNTSILCALPLKIQDV